MRRTPGPPYQSGHRRAAHNLLWHGDEKHDDIVRCSRRLHHARDSVVVYFTATPIMHGANALSDAKRMLTLVKGSNRTAADRSVPCWNFLVAARRGLCHAIRTEHVP